MMNKNLTADFPTHGKSSAQMNDRKPKMEMPMGGKPKSNTPSGFPKTMMPGGKDSKMNDKE